MKKGRVRVTGRHRESKGKGTNQATRQSIYKKIWSNLGVRTTNKLELSVEHL